MRDQLLQIQYCKNGNEYDAVCTNQDHRILFSVAGVPSKAELMQHIGMWFLSQSHLQFNIHVEQHTELKKSNKLNG